MWDRMQNGWIKLYRSMQESRSTYRQLYARQRDVFINLLLLANHRKNVCSFKGEKHTLKPGELKTSLKGIQEVCAADITIQNIRTSLRKLVDLNVIKQKSTKSGRIIKILNWSQYQHKKGKNTPKKLTKKSTKKLTKIEQETNKETNKDETGSKNQPESNLQDNKKQNQQRSQQRKSEKLTKKSTKKLTPNKKYKNIKKKDTIRKSSISSIRKIYKFWNTQEELTTHRIFTSHKKHIKARLADYTPAEIMTAIKNLNDAIADEDGFWSYSSWSLSDFLKRGQGAKIDKFLRGIKQFRNKKSTKQKSSRKNSNKEADLR